MASFLVSVIIPAYNEEENIKEIYRRLKTVFDGIEHKHELIFVNDGSSDATLEILNEIAKKDCQVKVIDFSRNFGHQLAVSAGIDLCAGDCAIIIDADLQDPPELIPEMIQKWSEGYHVVYAKRKKRKGESLFKLATAAIFYRLLGFFTNIEIPVDTGDFRLIDRRVVNVLKEMPEQNKFLRGLVAWAGFSQIGIEYIRDNRYRGKTKYPLKKMLKFALTGITSFSILPLQLASYFGFLISGLSLVYGGYIIYQKIVYEATIQGWASLMFAVMFFAGVQLLTLGVIGEYVGQIIVESKRRPLYIVKSTVNMSK